MNRYASLDLLCGLSVALMIVVNNPGNGAYVYSPLLHAKWAGCTLADLALPTFLYVVGVYMYLSSAQYAATPTRLSEVWKRTGLLFLAGLLLSAFPFVGKDYYTLRVMGILQRIALAYCLASFLCLGLSRLRLIYASGGILVGYWVALYLGGGDAPYSLEGNLVRSIDMAILTPEHVYKGYKIPFDPEGLLSTLPAAVTVVLGYLSGGLLAERGDDKNGLVKDLLMYGGILAACGLVWGQMFPIIRPLWTSSYVFFAGGISLVAFASCIWASDVRGWRWLSRPFGVFGAYPFFAIVLSVLLYKVSSLFSYAAFGGQERTPLYWVYHNIFYPIEQYAFGSLLFALAYCVVIWVCCWALYRGGFKVEGIGFSTFKPSKRTNNILR